MQKKDERKTIRRKENAMTEKRHDGN